MMDFKTADKKMSISSILNLLRYKLLLTLPFIYVGCSQLPKQLPEDFEVSLVNSAVQPGGNDVFSQIIQFNTDKKAYQFIQNYNKAVDTLTLDSNQMQRLYNELRNAKIFRLKSKYENLNTLDGSNIILTVKINGKTKVINMRNQHPDELRGVFNILNEFE
ncbi:MAG: hypothetical protein EBU52_01235, partial [Cytophagia bacterium]|nr:hypothetical protein [Cytophagia bacterium]